MTWFNNHLNWAWLIAFVIGVVLAVIVQTLVLSLGLYDPTVSAVARIIYYLVFLLVLIPASVYVLIKKGRSLWWLLLIGWFSPLWLTNNNKGIPPRG